MCSEVRVFYCIGGSRSRQRCVRAGILVATQRRYCDAHSQYDHRLPSTRRVTPTDHAEYGAAARPRRSALNTRPIGIRRYPRRRFLLRTRRGIVWRATVCSSLTAYSVAAGVVSIALLIPSRSCILPSRSPSKQLPRAYRIYRSCSWRGGRRRAFSSPL